MRRVQLSFDPGHTLLIPASWDQFIYRGFLYRRDDAGRWVTDRGWQKRSA